MVPARVCAFVLLLLTWPQFGLVIPYLSQQPVLLTAFGLSNALLVVFFFSFFFLYIVGPFLVPKGGKSTINLS